jgi:2-polyprenyl-6-methoxyphenol hydroxylase-like FAD-dependent oxidoreductase
MYGQDEHERLLASELGRLGVTVERRTELLGFEASEREVRARLKRPDGSEERAEAAYLAGCDGAHSAARNSLGIDFAGGTYSGVFYVADVRAAGPAANGEIHVDLEEADFNAAFPLKGAGRMRLVGPASWDLSERELKFEDVAPRASRNLRLEISDLNWFSTYRVHHRVAARFRAGRAFLLGDAAHVHSPVGGQGMNTGIGDAVNLAWKLAAVLKREAPESLLDTYEPERIRFARRLVATTDRAFTFVVKQGALARRVRTRLVPFILPIAVRLRAVRRLMFHLVSQIGVQYRHSALSTGAAGNVHGGDRLPWIELEGGKDNFEPLRSLKWQVHVYGGAAREVAQACAECGLELHSFAWRDSMRHAGISRGALYVVRPDGYVGLADSRGDAQALREYWRVHAAGVRP